jgi:glycosyltransferase involved in cell wall biosynthesis
MLMLKPKISIVVPVYMTESTIHRCVDSILNQTMKDIEVILVDDGSPDECPQICDAYGKEDPRVHVIHKENGGLSDARNAGLLKASGDYVLFVDSDDYIHEKTCEVFCEQLQEGMDILVGDAVQIQGDEEVEMSHVEIPSDSVLTGKEFMKIQLKADKMYMTAWLHLHRRDFLIENELFFKKGILHEDQQWTPRVFLKARKVKYVKFPFYYYVVRKDSIMRKKNQRKNGIDLVKTCYELEELYEALEDQELKSLLNDYLAMLFLNGVHTGNLYGKKYNDLYDKEFLTGKPLSFRNKAKAFLFKTNKHLYKYTNKFVTFLSRSVNVFYFLLFFFASAVFYKPYYVTHLEWDTVSTVYLTGLRIVFVLSFLIYGYKCRRSYSPVFLGLLLLYVCKGISTIINDGSVKAVISEAYPIIGAYTFFELGLKKKPKQLVSAFAAVLSILVLINFVTMITNPLNLTRKYWFFLRHANQLSPIYILTMVMLSLRNVQKKHWLRSILIAGMLGVCTYMIYYAESGSNIASWIPILVYYLFPFIMKREIVFNVITYSLAYIGVFVSVFVFEVQKKYTDIFVRLLKKDAKRVENLSGRINLWDNAIEMIKEKPVLGRGMTGDYNIVPTARDGLLSAHNQFLQLTIEGGLVSLFVFCLTAFFVPVKLFKERKNDAAKVISIGIFSIALVLFSEAMGFLDLIILFAFGYNVDFINKKKSKTYKKETSL